MGKIKTHRASCKRYAVTGTGKVKVFHSDHRHNLGQKTQKRKRHLRSSQILSPAMTATVKRLIGKD
ncbi:MAG: 50S ribosomal protein L35 [Eubacteriales bacterium]|nr:50S ribosomal protein L35 [Clostridiales bacterium]MDD7773664.1 50S ribosomal protein L35 [Eubacteriales bacterium]MDY3941326.1 50S ribosomal protein L35 [Eubacteriales bacterium]